MAHDHAHHDHAHHAPHTFNTAFALAVLLNAAFVSVQIGYAIFADSMSLLADAVHNFGDVCGLLLAWGANWLLTRPARERYSYGYKRTTIMAALINALLLTASVALIIYESIWKLWHLTPVHAGIVMTVAAIGIVINGSTALLFMRGAAEDLNIKGAFLHLAGDALISFGVVIAGGLIYWTHADWIDPLAGLLIVTIILWSTFGLLRNAVRLMLDAVPHHIDHTAVLAYLNQLNGVRAVHDLHIWGLSTREVALTAHLIMPEAKLSDEDFRVINACLRHDFHIHHATLQVESGHADHPCHVTERC